eukprot:scaffold61853_cov18-Tisochrysis_lutea.AAC.1
MHTRARTHTHTHAHVSARTLPHDHAGDQQGGASCGGHARKRPRRGVLVPGVCRAVAQGVHRAPRVEHARLCAVPAQREPADEQGAAAGQYAGGARGQGCRA